MSSNPVGNQIRGLQNQIDVLKKDNQLLLSALETKAPEIYADYLRSKEDIQEREIASKQMQQMQQQQQAMKFQPSVPTKGASSGRF